MHRKSKKNLLLYTILWYVSLCKNFQIKCAAVRQIHTSTRGKSILINNNSLSSLIGVIYLNTSTDKVVSFTYTFKNTNMQSAKSSKVVFL